MATSIQSSRWGAHTDELFREAGKAVSDGIRAVGLIQTEDTGQIDWETVEVPSLGSSTTAGVVVGYEIWRFNDALQATHPVFIKLEYGAQGRDTGAIPMLWVTIGRGSSGSGAITGVLAPRRGADAASYDSGNFTGAAAGYEPIYISSDGSSLCVVPRVRDGNTGVATKHVWAFVIDRSRDSSGNPTATGGVILTEGHGIITAAESSNAYSGASTAQMHAWTYAGDYTMGPVPATIPVNVNSLSAIDLSTTLANGDKAPVFPYIVVVPNHEPWQVLAAVGVAAGDAANGPFTATTLGRLRNYRSIPVTSSHNRWLLHFTRGHSGLCILWED